MKRTAAALFTFLLLIVPALPATAATFRAEEELSVSIPIGDDLYAAGGTVSVKQPVQGDLIIFGGDITIDTAITQDLVVGGGDISIEGGVGDDVRVAGGNIVIDADISDDLIVAGGSVVIKDGTSVNGDVRVMGGEVRIEGNIVGNLHARGGVVRMTGTVGGNADIRADTVKFEGKVQGATILASRNLEIGGKSVFGSDVTYWQPGGEYYFGTAKVGGTALYDSGLALSGFDDAKQTALGAMQVALLGLVGLALLSSAFFMLIMILATKTYFTDAAKRLQKFPGISAWYGFLYFVVTPILAFLFMLTIIGVPIGVFIVLMYLFTLFFAQPMASIVLAKWIELKYKKKWNWWRLLLASIGVYIVLKVIMLVPVIGWIAVLAAILMTFGALAHTEWEKYKKVR